MKIVTREQMQKIDKTTIEDYGIPSLILMENAGIAVLNKVIELYPDIINPDNFVTVLIGPGNNGGDGLVIARQLYNRGVEPFIVILGEEEKFKGDALTNLNIAKNLELYIATAPDQAKFDYHKKKILKSDFVIDAIFGTGLKGTPREFQSYVINEINDKYKNTVISVDVPSGMTSDTDNKSKTILKADNTITIALPKINMMDYPGKYYVGHLSVVNIGFPENLLKNKYIKYNFVGIKEASLLLNERNPMGHKGTFGRLLVIAGSNEYTGACILSAVSALKAGAGLVTMASVPKVCDSVRGIHPEIICDEMIEDESGNISDRNFNKLKAYLDSTDCIIIGPGINSYATFKMLKSLLALYRNKVVIDAGILNFYAKELDSLRKISANFVLTPHIKEFSRLVNIDVNDVIEGKVELCTKFCEEYNLYLVLKSAVTLVSDNNGNIYFNSTGNNGLATAGSGDVLTGIIGGLCSQGYSIPQASILGVFLHGLTGDLISKNESQHTLTAGQISDNLYKSIREVERVC